MNQEEKKFVNLMEKRILEVKLMCRQEEYIRLSKLEDTFSRTSKTRTSQMIDQMMRSILKEIDAIKKELDEK